MKKAMIILNLVLLSLFVSGCGCSKKVKTHSSQCENEANNNDYLYNVTYNFESNDEDLLINYKRTEKYTSDDNQFLDNMKTYKQNYFEKFSGIIGIESNINISENELNTELIIDFSKIDKEKLLEIEPFYLNFYDNNDNFNINYTVDYYIGEGMTCS